jgi:acetyltransferase-like isoleucine patch superfamily enzyme
MFKNFKKAWIIFWMRYSHIQGFGHLATRLALIFAPPFKGRFFLANLNLHGFVSPSVKISHSDFKIGRHVFIGDNVTIYQGQRGGKVTIGDRAYLVSDINIQTGQGGSLTIGHDTSIQSHCQFSAYLKEIDIGCGVQIAPHCAFYSYDHSFHPGMLIREQPLHSKGSIIVEDDALISHGVIVLSGVRIGKGAVIGAGSVVTKSVSDGAVAVGVPAKTIGKRY